MMTPLVLLLRAKIKRIPPGQLKKYRALDSLALKLKARGKLKDDSIKVK